MGLQDDLTLKINQWAAANEAEAAKGPAQVKADLTQKLYNDYLVAKETKETAPSEYTKALNAYLISRDGPEGVFEAYKRKALAMKGEYQNDFSANAKEALAVVGMYSTVSTYAMKAQENYLKQLDDYAAEIDAAHLLADEKNTAQRKSYYLHQVNDKTETWDGLLTVYIVALSAVYAKQFIAPNFKNPVPWVGLMLLLLSSYLLPRIVAFLVNIRPSMNVYTTWVQPNPIWTGSTLKYEPTGEKSGVVV